jgi:hypothetical protein
VSEKIVVIHQPDFLPHLGFFHRLLRADVFIILDHVPISKRGWVHRDKIKTPLGEEWITIPVRKIGSQPIIMEAEIEYNSQFEKVLRLIQSNYSSAQYYHEIFPPLIAQLNQCTTSLLNHNLGLLMLLLEWFDIHIAHMPRSSALGITTRKSQMNADLVTAVGGDTYLSGTGAKDYHEDSPFLDAGVTVVWQEFKHPVYPQLYGDFVPYLSSIDLLFNCGIKQSREILRGDL